MRRRNEVAQGGVGQTGITPADDSAGFIAWNEEMVRRYDIERYYEESHPIVRWLEAKRLYRLVTLAEIRRGERILEVGCGAGHVLQCFPDQVRTGVDLSRTMIERAGRRLGSRVKLARAAAEDLPFQDGAFDVVICTEVLEHTKDPGRVMAELLRVAGSRGRVLVSVPNERNIDRAKAILRRTPILRRLLATLAAEGNEWHLHHMNLKSLHELIRGRAMIERLYAVPGRVLPLRYVARLRSRRQA